MFKLTVQIDYVRQSYRTAQLTTISLCFLRQQWQGTKSKQVADVQESKTKTVLPFGLGSGQKHNA